MADHLLFEIPTPLGFTVRCSHSYWAYIVGQKHPILAGREGEVQLALEYPKEVRRSRKDSEVFMFYRADSNRWICAVVRRENGEGFLITAYRADAVKSGEIVWKKSG